MQKYRFKKIDAFVMGRSTGNPAGCVYLPSEDALSPEGMQQIARELAGIVNEVVYLFPDEGHTGMRYFSAEREVAFCGHGTIAAMYDLMKNDPVLFRDPVTRIHVGGQELLVRNEIAQADSVFISAPQPVEEKLLVSHDGVAVALRIAPGDISEKHRIAIINAGLSTLIVPIDSLDTLLSIHPDQQNLREFCLSNGIEIIVVFSPETWKAGNSYRTRVFAPIFGYLEDPATGSGNAALGYYLLKEGTWDGHMIAIEQGKIRENPNIIRLVSDASKVQRSVFFGGNAVVRIEGDYLLYP
jgi:PhzF family phenazine biosynthesis protein